MESINQTLSEMGNIVMCVPCWRGLAPSRCSRCQRLFETLGELAEDHYLNPKNFVLIDFLDEIEVAVPIGHPLHLQQKSWQTARGMQGVKYC